MGDENKLHKTEKKGKSKICFETDCDISMEDLLKKKLKHYVGKLDGLKRGNLYEIVLHCIEKPLFQMVLQETKWNQKKAADILGINRNTLRKKVKDLKIQNDK